MSIFDKKQEILDHIEAHKENISFNTAIFKILEGKLVDLVAASLQQQLSPDSYKTAMERVSPINIFRKATNKRSTLYTDEVVRSTELESDINLVSYYEDEGSVDSYWEDANKGYNAYKNTVLEIYVDEEEQRVRTRQLPSHQFLVYGDDPKDPLRVTAVIKFMGTMRKARGSEVEKYWVYTADEFMAIDSEGDLVKEDMEENEGLNPFGVIPFVYINKSRSLLVPYPDKDDLAISLLVPVLLTDLNFAAKFLAHSVFYGIDIDIEELKLSPDSVWIFKSDEKEGTTPQIGTIKPEVSINDVLTLITEQLTAWLDTKNIKAKGMGQVDANNTSGIAKIIDEADITLDRKQAMRIFREAELEYWKKLAQIHNMAAESRVIENTARFSDPKKLKVTIDYSDQKVLENRRELVERLDMEVKAGFRSIRSAVEELNPRLNEEELDALMLDAKPQLTFNEEPEEDE